LNNLTLGILISLAAWWTPAPTYSTGSATWYAPGVMRANCAYRGYDMTGYLDGVAMMSPADLGKTVWLRPPGQAWQGPFRVCDCGMRSQVYEMVTTRHEVVEVGWDTASAWSLGPHDGGWRLDGVEVLVDPAGPIWWGPVDYEDWFRALVDVVE
jgi:hypothetical protein